MPEPNPEMTNPAMICQELVEVITDYIEGTLPLSDRARFEAHLTRCSSCRIYLDQMRQTISSVGRLPDEDLPPVMRDDLLRLFRDWKHE